MWSSRRRRWARLWRLCWAEPNAVVYANTEAWRAELGATLLLWLVAIEQAGKEEEHRQHDGDLGVRALAEVELDHSVRGPNRTSDKPYPG